MSPNSLRVLAGAAAAVLVLLTGIAVGLTAPVTPCPPPAQGPSQDRPSASAPPAGAGVNPGSGGGQGAGNGQENNQRENGSQFSPQPDISRQGADPADSPAITPVAVLEDCTEDLFAPTPAVVAVLGAGLSATVGLVLMLLAGARRPAGAGAVTPVSGAPVRVPPGGDPRLDADRAALVRACIYVRDRVTSRALADRLAAALRDAGITVVEPVGDRFDPARHEAGGATPASDPSLTGTIAAVEVPGYVDRTGRVLRAPVVTVYQAGSGGGGSASVQHGSTTQRHHRRTEEDR